MHPPTHTQASFKVLGCSCNCGWLAYGSFQLTHMSHDAYSVELIEPWRPRRRQNIITVLTTLPQGWVSARKHHCTTTTTMMWTESSWAFPESYMPMTVGLCARAMAIDGRQKRTELHNRGEFLHNYYKFESMHNGDHDGVAFPASWEVWLFN